MRVLFFKLYDCILLDGIIAQNRRSNIYRAAEQFGADMICTFDRKIMTVSDANEALDRWVEYPVVCSPISTYIKDYSQYLNKLRGIPIGSDDLFHMLPEELSVIKMFINSPEIERAIYIGSQIEEFEFKYGERQLSGYDILTLPEYLEG